MNFIKIFIIALFLVFQTSYTQAFEDKVSKNFMGLYEVKQGVLAHDRGWFGVNREGFGPDYNFELMFNSPRFLKKIGNVLITTKPEIMLQIQIISQFFL